MGVFSGCRGLELCAYHGQWFPGENWCSSGTVIRMLGARYAHCETDNCVNGSRCPEFTGDCSLPLKENRLRSLVEECNGRTGCSVEAGRSWSLTCLSRGRTDYMKIEYDCVDPSSSSAAAVTTSAMYVTSGWSDSDDGLGMSFVSRSVLITIIVTAGHLSHCLHLRLSVCLSICLSVVIIFLAQSVNSNNK